MLFRSMEKMNQLIQDAHLHCLYSEQATGLKLKLLNVLFRGRFILLNNKMIAGSSIDAASVITEDNLSNWGSIIENQMQQAFLEEDLIIRRNSIHVHNDEIKAELLLKLIF